MIPFLIPWGGFDIVFVPFSEFVQVADKVGGYGIMFIVVAVNAVFVYFVKQASATRRFLHVQTYLPLVIISFLLFVPVIYGKFQLQKIRIGN